MKINTPYIKQLMSRDGLKQKDLADKLEMHPTALSYSLVNGKTTREIAERIAIIFNVPFSDIALSRDDVIFPDGADDQSMKKLEMIIDRKLDEKLTPLVDQIRILNKLLNHICGK